MIIQEKIYAAVKNIPYGKVLTYGSLAKRAGIQNPRVVGTFLHKNPDPKLIPCHRVVNATGKLAKQFAFGGLEGQKNKLEQEGIIVKEDKVDLDRYLWKQ